MAEQSEEQALQISWKAILIGMVFALVILAGLFRLVFCFYTFEAPLIPWISGIVGVVTVLLGSLFKALDSKFLKSLTNVLMGLLVTLAIVTLVAPLVVPDLNKNFCVPDFDTLVALIEQEGEAVLHEDMNIIMKIYEPQATIGRAEDGMFWPAYTYYLQKFAEEEHCMVNHADYTVISYTSQQVKISTSSRGTYGLTGNGCNMTYMNPPGADEWIFQKSNGEWKITSLEFNLHKKNSIPEE